MAGRREATLNLKSRRWAAPVSAWVRDTGSVELLVFIHGLGCSKRSFESAWSQECLRDRSLIAVDLPGFGRSPRPAGYDNDLLSQAELLASLIDAHASRRIHVIAHSMGGSLALLMPRRSLARLDSLSLVEARLIPASCGVAAEAAALDFERFQRRYLPRFRLRVAGDPRMSFDIERVDARVFYDSARSLLHWTGRGGLIERYLAAPCPRWFLYGSENAHLGELACLPPETTVAIGASGHFPMQDNADGFYRRVAAIVSGQPNVGISA